MSSLIRVLDGMFRSDVSSLILWWLTLLAGRPLWSGNWNYWTCCPLWSGKWNYWTCCPLWSEWSWHASYLGVISFFGHSLNKFLPSDSTLIYEMSLAGFKRIVSGRTILVPSTLDSSMATLQSALNTLGVVCLLDPTDVNQVQMNLEVRLSKI